MRIYIKIADDDVTLGWPFACSGGNPPRINKTLTWWSWYRAHRPQVQISARILYGAHRQFPTIGFYGSPIPWKASARGWLASLVNGIMRSND